MISVKDFVVDFGWWWLVFMNMSCLIFYPYIIVWYVLACIFGFYTSIVLDYLSVSREYLEFLLLYFMLNFVVAISFWLVISICVLAWITTMDNHFLFLLWEFILDMDKNLYRRILFK